MKVLVIGSGGREHAICWKLAQSPLAKEIFVAPGSVGIALENKITCTGMSASDFEGIASFCEKQKVGFVVVGPDQALADGIVDFLDSRGIPAFGPVKDAARIESSKAFSKEIMRAHGIPTASFHVFTQIGEAQAFLRSVDWGDGWVVKADGLALGKGVVVCETRNQALSVVEDFLAKGEMGKAGKRVVIEERMLGREASGFYLCDGQRAVPIGFACDYKRLEDKDRGPNTGGMGAFSPADWLPEGTKELVHQKIALPLLKALEERGTPYKGILYCGLMITKDGPKVVEFNARFGDPETQALLPLLDEDLLPWLVAAREGKLNEMPEGGPRLKDMSAVHIVMASHGYPGTGGKEVRKGDKIQIPTELLPVAGDSERLVKLFFAGVGRSGHPPEFVTAGGRVLGLTALAQNRPEARRKAYEIIASITFEGAQRRNDVGA